MSVMVIMPAFAPRDRGDKAVIAGCVARFESPFAPQMRRRINQPCRMPADNHAEKYRPQDHRETTDSEKNDTCDDGCYPIIFIEPNLERIFYEVRRVAFLYGKAV